MRWKHPHHTWWLAACFAGLALSALVGGLNAAVLVVFLMIFLVGAVLIRLDDVAMVPVFAGPPDPATDDDAADRITVIDTTDAVPDPDADPDDGDLPAEPDEPTPADGKAAAEEGGEAPADEGAPEGDAPEDSPESPPA